MIRFACFVIVVLCAHSVVAQTGGSTAATGRGNYALDEVRRVIDAGNAKWADAWSRGDATAVADLFAEDGKFLSSTGKVIKGRQQLLERYKTAMQAIGKELTEMKVTVATANVWLDGDMAYETGKYSYSYKENGKPAVEAGKYVTIWKRQKDGSWKLFMDMGVPND